MKKRLTLAILLSAASVQSLAAHSIPDRGSDAFSPQVNQREERSFSYQGYYVIRYKDTKAQYKHTDSGRIDAGSREEAMELARTNIMATAQQIWLWNQNIELIDLGVTSLRERN